MGGRTVSEPKPYHHGDLRAALVRSAVATITELGVARTSVREVARRTEVSHAAAAYHFGDRAGLLTAVATEGYHVLGAALSAARERGSFLDVGVAYVQFSIEHPAYFDVMYQPGLYDPSDADLVAAKAETAAILYGSRDATDDQVAAGVAAWSIVHGLATLWRNGNIPARLGTDPLEVTRVVARHLRMPRGAG
jgi:AcrR family transcriptional regulator